MESVSENGSNTGDTTSRIKPKVVQKSAPLNLDVKSKSKLHATNMKQKARDDYASESPATDVSVVMAPDTNGLPQFTRSSWSTIFLPTLYSRLGCATNPFVIGADMVKVIQEVVDLVYPDSDYRVRVNDKIFTLVRVLSSTFFM